MRHARFAVFLLGLLSPVLASAACVVPPGPLPVEATPVALPDPNWQKRQAELEQMLASADLSHVRTVFLGDSITASWPQNMWDHFYGTRGALNLGVSGDGTQGLLWRIQRMPLGTKLNPKLFVVLIGTNNLWPQVNPANVVTGIAAVLAQLHAKVPGAKILLLNILPRGEAPSDHGRELARETNRLLAACAAPGIALADPGPVLLDGHGMLSKDISFDTLHLTWLGYAMLGAALEPAMKRELGE